MRRSSLALAAGLLLTLLLPTVASAAQQSQELQVLEWDVASYPTVAVTVTAPRELVGRDVPPEAFRISEDGEGKTPRVTKVDTDTLEVLLVVDTSGSMLGQPMDAAKAAAIDFVSQMPPGVRIGVVGFSEEPSVAANFSTDPSSAIAAIEGLEARAETALYDGVLAGLDLFTDGDGIRRSMVLLSDGGDTVSQAPLEDAVARLAQDEIAFHAIELQSAETDPDALAALADAAGGRVVPATDPDALAGVYDSIASELVNQYRVEYTSSGHGATPVEISLDHDGVRATHSLTLQFPAAPPPVIEEPPPIALPPTIEIVAVDDSEYPEVSITVVAPRDLAEADLEAAAFELNEGGRQATISAERVPGGDLDVVLALDASGSMAGESLVEAKAAAMRFVSDLPEGARVAVVAFAEEFQLIQDFTGNRENLRSAIASVEAGGETALWDATAAIPELFEGRDPSLRSVIFLSDGGDTVSELGRDDAVASLTDAGLRFVAVEFQTDESDPAALQALAGATDGGSVTPAADAATLATVYEDLSTDLGNQYVLRYRSAMHGRTDVEVGVAADGVVATARSQLLLPPLPWLLRFLGSDWGLGIGAAAIYVALATIILQLVNRSPSFSTRLAGNRWQTAKKADSSFGQLLNWANASIERGLVYRGIGKRVNEQLERAGMPLRPGEYVLLGVAAATVAMLSGSVVAGPLFGVFLLVVVTGALLIIPQVMMSRRREAFTDQLGDTLQLLAGSLRTGYGLLQSMDAVAKEADRPTSDEFRRLVVETRLGRDLHASLRAMADRVGSVDFEWIVQAIEIHSEVGGDLADVLDTVAKTIRDRNEVARQVKALSAEGRLGGVILVVLPFVVLGGLMLTNPNYIGEMTGNPIGLVMLAVGGVMMAIGAFWISRVVRVEY